MLDYNFEQIKLYEEKENREFIMVKVEEAEIIQKPYLSLKIFKLDQIIDNRGAHCIC